MNRRQYLDDLAGRWDSLPAPPDAAERAGRLVDRMRLGPARVVLDVGCGTGVLVPHLARTLGPEAAPILELDFAGAMVRSSLEKRPSGRVAGLCADARRLPVATEACDAVVCFGVLPHLGDVRAVIPELLRVLTPRGVFAVGHLMNSEELNTFHSALDQPVSGDRLPPASVVADILAGEHLDAIVAEERPGWYLVRGQRAAP